MKKNALYLIVLILVMTACSDRTFYDITPPKLLWSVLTEDNQLLMQFNEPIRRLHYAVGQYIADAVINFPKNNIIIPEEELTQIKVDTFIITADDTSGHSAEYRIGVPKINNHPAALSIASLQLRYSDKSPQTVTFRSANRGETTGYKAVFFIRNEFLAIPMDSLHLNAGQNVSLRFIPSEMQDYDGCRIHSMMQNISFDRGRLSPSCAAVYILDNHDTILDYIFYIDTKKNDETYYYEKSRSFHKISQHLSDLIEDIQITDVVGNSIRRPIVKRGEQFVVAEQPKQSNPKKSKNKK